MGTPRLLLIEDDQSLREAIRAALNKAGYDVRAEADGEDFSETVSEFLPDLAILDVRLPGEADGFELARKLRGLAVVPVLFVTAADTLEDRLRGFDVGADDYLVKPFAIAELLARIRAILRRTGRLTSTTHEIGDLLIDESTRTVRRAGNDIALTRIEFELLTALARNTGQVLSKAQLLSLVWGFEGYHDNLVEVHVSALRRKLEAHGRRLVHTEHGEGYVLRLPFPS